MRRDQRSALSSGTSLFALALTLLACCTFGAGRLAATEASPWEAGAFAADPSALLQAAAQVTAGDGDGGVVVLFSEIRLRFEEDGRKTRVQYMVYRIVNAQAAEDWHTVQRAWFPWCQERPELRARVISPDGTVHTLDPATVTEAALVQEPSVFEDGRILRAPLPATGPGAIVERQTILRDFAPFFAQGTTDQVFLRWFVPVLHARLLIDAPEGFPLHYVFRQLPEEGLRVEVADGRRRLSYEARDLAPIGEIESHQPPDVRAFPYVALSTGASWAAVAQGYAEIVERVVREAGQTPEIQAFLRDVRVPGASRRATIDRVLARIGTDIRYTGVELGMGRIVPRPPAATLKSKFGDCKDKSVLLVALLRALDIPAEVALVRVGEEKVEIEPSLPGIGAFNHAIVVLPATTDSPEIWIDPTDRFARAGELGARAQGRLALIANPRTRELVRTPESTAKDNRTVETREFFLADLGPSRVVATSESWGETERLLRSYFSRQDEKSRRETLARGIQATYPSGELGTIEFSDPFDLAAPFRGRIEVKQAGRGLTNLQRATVAVFPKDVLTKLPDDLSAQETGPDGQPELRRSDYFLARPFQTEIRYRAVPPAGFRAQPPPANRVRRLGPATLSEEYAVADDGALLATLRFEIDKRRLSAAEVEALREGAQEVEGEDGVLLQFEPLGEALLAEGRAPEAFAELRRLVSRSPQKPLPHTQLARALLAGGMGEAAREAARRAVELDPSSVPAYQTLAWILQHDEIGRRFGPGFDLAGAVAAYRKAKELDPKDRATRTNLALLLEHDASGQQYTPGADLEAAIAEYRALHKDLDDASTAENLLLTLMWRERYGEMKELLAELGASDARSILQLVAIAATDGSAAALREAERRIPDGETRRNALLEASGYLAQLRRYPEAAALLAGAARQAPNAAELLARVDLLRKVRRHEEIVFAADDPADLVRRHVILYLSPGTFGGSPDETAWFSRDLLQQLGGEEAARRWLAAEAVELRRAVSGQSEPLADEVVDLTLALFRITVTGDAAGGYRVSLTAPGDNQQRFSALVVRGDEGLRIAALNVEQIAADTLRRLNRGDLRAARQWLDWSREVVQSVGGDDPLASHPFTTLWTRGAEATSEEARCATASLMTTGDLTEEAVPLLLACRNTVPEGAHRTAIDLALAAAFQHLERWSDLEAVAQRLAAASPRSPGAYGLHATVLTRLERWDDLRRLAEDRLAVLPDDLPALLTLYNLAETQGDLETAETWLRRAGKGGTESSVDNNLAWLALVRNRVDDQAIEIAQRAVTHADYQDPFSLHTLAALYAEQGRTAEAYQLIQQALELKDDRKPASADWYVFGRLAERYGLPEEARRLYARVEPPQKGEAESTSTYRLARRRLDAIKPATGSEP